MTSLRWAVFVAMLLAVVYWAAARQKSGTHDDAFSDEGLLEADAA